MHDAHSSGAHGNSPDLGGPSWPDEDHPGLRIGEAAALVGVTVKAIRVYHDRGIVAEPERDESGYRRYHAPELVALARITRLRAVGLSLREIAPLLGNEDRGARLRQALEDLDGALAAKMAECEQRRTLLALLLAEEVDDPIAVSAADIWEERSLALLRAAIPDLTPAQELLERRFARALSALVPDAWGEEDGTAADEATVALGFDGDHSSELVSQHRRFHALADLDPEDPRVYALAEEASAAMGELFAALPEQTPEEQARFDPEQSQRAMIGLAAALDVLAPAQRRVMELVLSQLFEQDDASAP